MRERTVRDHLDILCDGGYLRRDGKKCSNQGNRFSVVKSKKWIRRDSKAKPELANNRQVLGEISQSLGEISQSYIRKDNTETIQDNKPSEDLSVLSRILCESIGCFDLREQGSIHQLLSSHARHSNKTYEAATDHIISRWNEYQKGISEGKIAATYSLSAYRFLMSGKWDNPNIWNWKENNAPLPKRKYVTQEKPSA